MYVIKAVNVNDAFTQGMRALKDYGVPQASRVGDVIVMPWPVTTCYEKPTQRVLFSPVRDANPFFHLMEALWMLAGRNDGRWLDNFVADFSTRFGEDGGIIHGAYGHRWREAFGFDQLDHVIKTLRGDSLSRQCVIGMWDPSLEQYDDAGVPFVGGMNDLRGQWKDRPCNTHVYLRVQGDRGQTDHGNGNVSDYDHRVLNMTVCCRSNDMIMGAYGANAVHFSVLQEYLAARIGVGVGVYYQMSNNFHAYVNDLKKFEGQELHYVAPSQAEPTVIVTEPEAFDDDLEKFFDVGTSFEGSRATYVNKFFPEIAIPMFWAYKHWRAKERLKALQRIGGMPYTSDWRMTSLMWMDRRMNKTAGGKVVGG
jgi:thymidylate synthase